MKNTVKEDVKPLNWGAALFAVLIVGVTFYQCNRPSKPLTRTEKIERAFSPFSGAHRELQSTIKNSLKDPDSYEHINTGYVDKGDYLIVTTTYRAKNSFGGMVVETVKAKSDLKGKVILIY